MGYAAEVYGFVKGLYGYIGTKYMEFAAHCS